MPRFSFVLAAALLPALAAADAPPPDRFTPCVGLQASDPCFEAGCTCVTVTVECPGGAASCLSCQVADGGWCGPTYYHPERGESFGCSYGGPAGASALGLLGIALLARRRR